MHGVLYAAGSPHFREAPSPHIIHQAAYRNYWSVLLRKDDNTGINNMLSRVKIPGM